MPHSMNKTLEGVLGEGKGEGWGKEVREVGERTPHSEAGAALKCCS